MSKAEQMPVIDNSDFAVNQRTEAVLQEYRALANHPALQPLIIEAFSYGSRQINIKLGVLNYRLEFGKIVDRGGGLLSLQIESEESYEAAEIAVRQQLLTQSIDDFDGFSIPMDSNVRRYDSVYVKVSGLYESEETDKNLAELDQLDQISNLASRFKTALDKFHQEILIESAPGVAT